MLDLKHHARKQRRSVRTRQSKMGIQVNKKKIKITSHTQYSKTPKNSNFFQKAFTFWPFSKTKIDSHNYFVFSRLFLGVLVLLFLSWSSIGLIWESSAFFTSLPEQIIIEGNKRLSPEDIYRIAQFPQDIPSNQIDSFILSQRLNTYPLIQKAEVRRIFPNRWFISIQERVPFAYLKSGNEHFLIDREQIPLESIKPKIKQDPVLVGIKQEKVQLGIPIASLALEKGLQFLETLRSLSPPYKNIQEIDVSDVMNLKIKLQNYRFTVELGQNQFFEKLEKLDEILPPLLAENNKIHSIDLRFPNKAYVQY